ncbi:MAG: hypothetical protein AAF748_00565 [Pseudomonadota bacterium]
MTKSLPLTALILMIPALAAAKTDYRSLVARAEANPQHAASLHDAFCFGGSPTPKWVCDQLKAAERPILDRDPPMHTMTLK